MKISFPVSLTAADSNRRIISGRIVSWNEEGSTSAGRTMFKKDSIDYSKPVKLLMEHDNSARGVLGKMLSIESTDQGLEASFKIANTIQGDDALELAANQLVDGFSVGVSVDAWENIEGVLTVEASKLREVSLVNVPAIDTARVSEVAASEQENKENSEATAEEQTTNQEEKVSDTTSEAPIATEAVEAAKSEPTVQFTAPVAYTKPRVNLNISAGQHVKAQYLATLGDTDARDICATIQHATTSENAGVVPVPYLTEVIGIIDSRRPFINSIGRRTLPAAGTSFKIPTLGTQATVAQTAEAVEADSTDTTITSTTVNVVKFAGANIISAEILERSEPAYLDLLIQELSASYARKTDAYAIAQAKSGGSTSAGAAGKGWVGGIAKGIGDSTGVMTFAPNNLMIDPNEIASIIGTTDSAGRPLFAALQPQNAAGNIALAQGVSGNVMGLTLIVDPNTIDGDISVYPSGFADFYEAAGAPVQVRTTAVSTMEFEIGVYGFCAFANKYPTAYRKVELN
jgi:HK97 family phage prohead protease